MQKYVKFPPHLEVTGPLLSLVMVVLVWWCAHRLTWDCTYLDDRVGATGEGILQAAGIETDEGTSVERYRKKQKDEEGGKRTPGVWVIFFSLAALPLFGVGQTVIPPDEVERRRYTFWLMVIYTGSGLGLLLTTSFLGLRLYLRRRNLRMPAAMTAAWLTLGCAAAVALLVAGALLPRPNAEVKLFDLPRIGAEEKQEARKDGDGKDSDDGGGKEPKDRKDDASKDRKGAQQKEKDGKGGKDEKDKDGGGKDGEESSQASEPGPGGGMPEWLRQVLAILRVVILLLVGVAVLVLVLRAFLQMASGIFGWARGMLKAIDSLWASILALFGRKPAAVEEETADADDESVPRPPFEAFSNPFADGRAGRMSPDELVRYSFGALEAWARDRQLGRADAETPLELAARLGEEIPKLGPEVKRLGQLYALAVYGRGGIPQGAREVVKRFWEALESATEAPQPA
jgi:hypothetical protein